MGIISWFRSAFTHDIVLNEDISNELLYYIPLKNKEIKIDSKVTVKNGHIFAVGYHGKALDYLPVGTHFLSAVTLPNCSKKFKLYKTTDNGKKKKSFRAEAYYINISTFDATFATDKIELKDEKYGIFKAKYIGKYNFTVTDYKKTFAILYGISSCKRTRQAFEIIEDLVNEYLYDLLRVANFSVDDNREYSEKLRTYVMENFQKKIFDFGLNLNSFEITDIIFNKKLMKRLNYTDVKLVNEEGKEISNNSVYQNAFHLPESETLPVKVSKEEKKEKNADETTFFGLWDNGLTKSEEENLKKLEPELPKVKHYAYEKYTQTKQEEEKAKEEEKDKLEERKKQGMFDFFGAPPSTYMTDAPKPQKSEKVIKAEKNIEFALFGQDEASMKKEKETDKRATSKSFVNLSLDNPMFSTPKKTIKKDDDNE